MPLPQQQIQSVHVARCVVNLASTLLSGVMAALNTQKAARGDAIRDTIVGCRIITAAGSFTVSNPDGTGTLTITTAMLPYDIPAVQGMADTLVNAVALGVEVYYDGPSRT